MHDLIGLDFETYSAVDLPTHGLYRYVSHSTFTPLIASLTWYKSYGSTRMKKRKRIEFPGDFTGAVEELEYYLTGKKIVAHNAVFEQWVLRAIGIDLPSDRFIDSAVVARAVGAAGKLEAAAPQLLNTDKLESGSRLIKLFCVPGKYQEETDCLAFDARIIEEFPGSWDEFGHYCDVDSELGLDIVDQYLTDVPEVELKNMAVTMDMNWTGWHVDVPTVEEMQRRYLENMDQALADFHQRHGDKTPNLNSLKQMKEFCAERGIKASSFDEKHVAKLVARIEAKLISMQLQPVSKLNIDKAQLYEEVLDMLRTKQILGGSSLKKLQVILDTTGKDCRLRDQYVHVGAGQTYRTSGRGVQMQNLKRLSELGDMDELNDLGVEWDNDKLAENIRQCFTSSHPQGALIVGDFSSVESRGLAWQAGAEDKLLAFRNGLDIYKVGAAKQYGVAYDAVTKSQRQFGKVGELSCGYQAGGDAVKSFAEGMGVTLTEGEANQIVFDWRDSNPDIVQYWADLHDLLETVVAGKTYAATNIGPSKDYKVSVFHIETPASLLAMSQHVQSIGVSMTKPSGEVILYRVFHGLYRRGKDICYFKPTERKTGDVWKNHYTDPKTKQVRFYNIYGGKLAGILTQSLCREIFFDVLRRTHAWVGGLGNVDLVGQFHDEIVLDWQPGPMQLDATKQGLETLMSGSTIVYDFPLAAEIKHDYRYTK